MQLFSTDGFLMRFLNIIADILILHFLWLLCSLPIITIGASTTALYYACMKRIRTKEGYITRNFFQSFRSNLKQSTILWLLLLAVGYLFYLDFQIIGLSNGLIHQVMFFSCFLFAIPFLLVFLYIFPVQAKFKNSIWQNLKNSLFMSFRHFGLTLVLFIIWGTFLLLGFTFPPMLGVLLICGSGLIGYLTSMVFIQIFRNYIPDELERDIEISGEKFDSFQQ